jgi:ribonuclease HII
MAAFPYTPRRSAGLAAYENALARAGLTPVAGIDEAGRGACAGPLVVAAVVLDPAGLKRVRGLADSKLLTAAAREDVYARVVEHAVAWHVTVIPHTDIDSHGLHVCNIAGMRRAFAGLAAPPAYVLIDGFPVSGLGAPSLAMWKGDRVAASVAAASVVALAEHGPSPVHRRSFRCVPGPARVREAELVLSGPVLSGSGPAGGE